MIAAESKPSLLGVVLLLLDDACPPEAGMQLCRRTDVDDGESCRRCWRRYAFYVANGRKTTAWKRRYQPRNHQRNQFNQ